jgi:hypothetical protein
VSSTKAFLINGIGEIIKDIGTGYDKAFINVGFKFLEKTLICIDDFERNSSHLGAQNILGTISLLKEKQNCKVVLIFNDNELSDADKETYDLLKEKVVDYEIHFFLTPEEIMEITFDKELQTDVALREKLAPHIKQLSINNLRILKKIKEFCQTVLGALPDDSEEELINQAMQTSVLFVWSYYSKNQGTPSYEFLKGFDCFNDVFSDKEEGEDKVKNKWVNLLDEYNFKSCDEFDLEISVAVENNYIDKEKLNTLADQINANLRNGKSRESFHAIWRKFHRSFEGDKNSFSKELIQSFSDSVEVLDRSALNPTVVLLKELGFKKETDKLIDLFISKHKGENDIFDLSDPIPGEKLTDEVLIEKFGKQFEKNKVMRDLKNILIDVSQNNRTTKSDEEVILSSLSNEYYSAFKNLDGEKIGNIIKECLRFCELRKTEENYKNAYNNIAEALQKIGKENELNVIRLKRMGLNLDELKEK